MEKKKNSHTGSGIVFGFIFGAAFGLVLFDQIALGGAIGM